MGTQPLIGSCYSGRGTPYRLVSKGFLALADENLKLIVEMLEKRQHTSLYAKAGAAVLTGNS